MTHGFSRKRVEFNIGGRRWYGVGLSERNSHKWMTMSKEITRFQDQSHMFTTLMALVNGSESHRKSGKGILRPKFHLRSVVGTILTGISNRVRFEICWHKHDDDTPPYIRAAPGQCSRSVVNLKFFKHIIEIPH